MSAQEFVIQVRGRLPAHALVLVSAMPASVRLLTVFSARLRDRAAVDGLLRRVSDLGLDLIGFQQLAPAAAHSTSQGASSLGGGNPVEVEVVVDGPVGDLALSAMTGTSRPDAAGDPVACHRSLHDGRDPQPPQELGCGARVRRPWATAEHHTPASGNSGPEALAGTTKHTIGLGDPRMTHPARAGHTDPGPYLRTPPRWWRSPRGIDIGPCPRRGDPVQNTWMGR